MDTTMDIIPAIPQEVSPALFGDLQTFIGDAHQRGVMAAHLLTMAVTDAEDYGMADEERRRVKQEIAAVTEAMKPRKKTLDELKSFLLASERYGCAPWAAIDTHLGQEMTAWSVAKLRKQEELARTQAQALQEEAQAARAREIAAVQAVDPGQARILAQAPLVVPMVPKALAPAGTEGTGSTLRKTWKIEVVDPLALAQAIVAGQFPRTWLAFDELAITDHIRSHGGMDVPPGVEPHQEVTTVTRKGTKS